MRLWKPGELIQQEFPDPLWLCKPLIPLSGIAIAHGAPGSGKTQYYMTLAHAIMTGGHFLDQFPCEQGPVVFIALDMITRLIYERLKLAEELFDRLPFWQITGDEFMNVFDWQVQGSKHPIVKELRDLKPLAVIVDTYKRSYKFPARRDFSETENEPTLVYQAWRDVVPGASILFTHHDKKKPTGMFTGDPDERYSGMATILGSAETGLHLTREKKVKDKHLVQIAMSKARMSELQPDMMLEMNKGTLFLKPTEPTPLQLGFEYAKKHPGCSHVAIQVYLETIGACQRTRGFEVANAVLGGRKFTEDGSPQGGEPVRPLAD